MQTMVIQQQKESTINGKRTSDQIKSVVQRSKLEPGTVQSVLKQVTSEQKVLPNIIVNAEIARALLDLNTENRPVKKRLLQRYTSDMKEGRWIFSGNMVKYDWNMVQRDGQHSLLATIESDTVQVFNIQTGLDPKSFNVMDIGGSRSAGDILAMKGFESYNILSAAIKTIMMYERSNRIKKYVHNASIPNADVDRFSEKKNEMKTLSEYSKEVLRLRAIKKGVFMAPATWVFLWYILAKKDKEQAAEFVEKLSTGENISMQKNAPIYLLRELLTQFGTEHIGVLRSGGTMVTELKIRYVFRAWNAWRNREKITKLKVNLKDNELESLI
jgi:hypothetical protein